jgi:septal ring factor EnvC (AmiA/AmiB activator)
MERNRWETALRCLEIAVHPNTSDEEALAAVRGFRRTAGKTPLVQLCPEFANAPGHLLSRLDQLNRANLELQRKIEEADADRLTALQSLKAAEQRTREIAEELLATEHRADAAERQLAEFQGAYGRISGGLRGENDDLRRALDDARRNMAQPIHEPTQPFQSALNAALQRPDSPPPAPAFGRPWTA